MIVQYITPEWKATHYGRGLGPTEFGGGRWEVVGQRGTTVGQDYVITPP